MTVLTEGNFARLNALARRDLQIEHSYRMRYFVRLFQVLLSIGILYYLSNFLEDAPALTPYGGSYFDFAIVGLAVMAVAQLGISTFNENILREQNLGTFEVLLATPTPIPVLLAGSFVFPLLLTFFDLLLYLGVGLGVFGGGLTITGVVLSVPLVLLTLASFCAFGVAGAGLVVLVKRGDPLTAPLTLVTTILSGALFPVSEYPPVVEALAHLFPAFYGINGLREALLQSGGLADVAPDMLILAAFDIVLLPISVYLFNRCLRAARRTGVLGNY